MDREQVDRIVEAINEGFETQNIILLRVATALERIEITLKLTAAILVRREQEPDNDAPGSTGEDSDV